MIYDIIFIKIYRLKTADPSHIAKVIVILLQSLALSSVIRYLIMKLYGLEYVESLFENDNMRLVYLLPIIPSGIVTHFMYKQVRIKYLNEKYYEYTKTQFNKRLLFNMCVALLLIFSNTILSQIIS